MSKLQQYILLGGLLFLIYGTPIGRLLKSSAFLNVVWGMIGFLLIVAVIITWPEIKEKLKKKKKRKSSFWDKEGF